MPTVIVSSKFEIVIPPEIREALSIQPGEEMQVFHFENRIELIPVRSIREMRGLLRGIDTTVDRGPDRL